MKALRRLLAPLVLGILCGFDRYHFRGSKRRLCYPDGIMSYFSCHSKEDTDLAISAKHDRTKGLIAVLGSVEPSIHLMLCKNRLLLIAAWPRSIRG